MVSKPEVLIYNGVNAPGEEFETEMVKAGVGGGVPVPEELVLEPPHAIIPKMAAAARKNPTTLKRATNYLTHKGI